jgi:hypothetical protein
MYFNCSYYPTATSRACQTSGSRTLAQGRTFFNTSFITKLRLPILLLTTTTRMRRRTFRQIKARSDAALHHSVYVVLLDPAAAKSLRRNNPQRNPAKPCVYVGMTGLAPEERFANHKSGLKAAAIVTQFGVRLLPELYEIYNPMPFDVAVAMEQELAEDLRRLGYTVAGGH